MNSLALIFAPVASGLLLAMSLSPGPGQWLAWVALVPLGLALRDRRNWPELYFGLYLGGLAFHLIHLDWVRAGTGPGGLSGPRATQWLAQGVVLALFWPIGLGVGRWFIQRTRLPMAAALPIVWVAFEFARHYWWAIFDATGYPYGLIALSQAEHPLLIQTADLGGAYAVAALVAAVNGLVVDLLLFYFARRQGSPARVPWTAAAGVALLLAVSLAYGGWRLSQDVPRTGPVVCLMPVDTADVLRDERLTDSERADAVVGWRVAPSRGKSNGAARPIDFLVWSEGCVHEPMEVAGTLDPNGDKSVEENAVVARMAQVARLANAALVVGCDRTAPGTHDTYNSAAVVDRRQGYLGAYDKVRLVPFSEFYPPGRPGLGSAGRNCFVHGTAYPVFTTRADDAERAARFAVAICYDAGFSELFRRYMRGGPGEPPPEFFVVPACESHDRKWRLQHVLLALTRFRAVETRRAIVRNAEGGYSGVVDGNGMLVDAPDDLDFQSPVTLEPLPLDDRLSIYAWLGDWLPMGALATIALTISLSIVRGRRPQVERQKGSSNGV